MRFAFLQNLDRRYKMAIILFYVGLALSVIIPMLSITRDGDDKRALVAAPFMFLVASAVAKYLGM